MSISGLVQTLFFAAIFLVFIDGSIGWLLIYTIIVALAMSFVCCIISRKRFDISAEDYSGITTAGGECEATFRITKNGFCFIPFVALEGSFAGQRFVVRTTLLFKKSVSVTVSLSPDCCGLQKAVIERSVAEDFFGLLRLKCNRNVSTSVAVLPRNVDYIGPNVVPSVLPSEDEEREEGKTVMFGGTAGYEHRPYTDGDSPRRINYKLSAKKQQLMVRLDESSGTESTNMIIEAGAGSDPAEQAFALAGKLVLSGSPVTVYYLGERFSAASPTALVQLREWLAFRELDAASGETVIPEGTVNVVFSKYGNIRIM